MRIPPAPVHQGARKLHRVHPRQARRLLIVITYLTLAGLVGARASQSDAVSLPLSSAAVYLPVVMNRCGAASGQDWPQEAHDAQRTGYTPEEPVEPWTLLWTWNGPDSNGGTGNHFYDAPREARTVAGNCLIYVPAGAQGLYALRQADGGVQWHLPLATFNATPAVDVGRGVVLAGSSNGLLYKVSTTTGQVLDTYNAGGPLNRAVLMTDGYAYVVTDAGVLHKVSELTMTAVWTYTAGSATSSGLAYSAARQLIIFGTADLKVHAVNSASGSTKWAAKPSPNTPGFPNEYLWYWPVVADSHGLVFIRMRLDHNAGLWGYPGAGGIWPNTNAEARAFLQANPAYRNLFALDLDDGTEAFVAAVGYGGTEDLVNDAAYLTTGPPPAVKQYPDGTEVAYTFFRNGQHSPPDGRWDAHLGEMVLDTTSVPGLLAGDLRFIRFVKPFAITDEQNPLTVAGNTVFHAHWGASESVRITDRSLTKGLTYSSPISSVNHPTLIRRLTACSNKNTTTHWTTCGLTLFDDGRFWSGPGWWTYWNVLDPPTSHRNAYSDGIRPRYTYVSDGLVIAEGNGGELMVFRHSGAAQ